MAVAKLAGSADEIPGFGQMRKANLAIDRGMAVAEFAGSADEIPGFGQMRKADLAMDRGMAVANDAGRTGNKNKNKKNRLKHDANSGNEQQTPDSSTHEHIPAMPCVLCPPAHRGKNVAEEPLFHACVARPVGKAEIKSTPAAQASFDKEWDRLVTIRVWDEDKVEEKFRVAQRAREKGEKAHFGRIFELCVEKNSEQPADSPHRKFKGRSVFQGNDVKDENADIAIFGEMSSSPATMEAGKATDYYGLFPGHDIETADAEQAYTQARLRGIATWASLPPERWPKRWRGKYKQPVVPLRLALYGHPDSGGHWEEHCEKHVLSVGFTKIRDWLSCYFHPRLKLFLVIYVDDFKLAGPTENLAEGWKLLKQGIKMDDPAPLDRYLGCHQRIANQEVDGQMVRSITYDMSDFLSSCVDRYLELAQVGREKLKQVKTPYLQASDKADFQGTEPTPTYPYGLIDPLPDDGDDDVWAPEDEKVQGHLAHIASRVLMKILYAARMARVDLLRPTCFLATKVTKWTRTCDRLLLRLVSYINSTLDLMMVAWVGDKPEDVQLKLFTDADLAGEATNSKSTSGVFLVLRGPRTFAPIAGVSKKQTCTSHSTPEAEMVAGDLGLRTVGFPALSLWEAILGRTPELEFNEDNEACIQIVRTGKSPALRRCSRTHKIDIGLLHDSFKKKVYTMRHCRSRQQAADIFTKVITEDPKWVGLLALIGLGSPKTIKQQQEFYDYELKEERNKELAKEQKKLANQAEKSQKHTATPAGQVRGSFSPTSSSTTSATQDHVIVYMTCHASCLHSCDTFCSFMHLRKGPGCRTITWLMPTLAGRCRPGRARLLGPVPLVQRADARNNECAWSSPLSPPPAATPPITSHSLFFRQQWPSILRASRGCFRYRVVLDFIGRGGGGGGGWLP